MYSQIRVFAFLIFVLGISSYLAADIQIHDPGYQAKYLRAIRWEDLQAI